MERHFTIKVSDHVKNRGKIAEVTCTFDLSIDDNLLNDSEFIKYFLNAVGKSTKEYVGELVIQRKHNLLEKREQIQKEDTKL